jgi:uncharacterized protein (TIGR02246 family)
MSDEVTIKELLEKRYAECLNSGDVDGYVSLYSDDVIWGAPNMPDATSPPQIASLLTKLFENVSQHLEVTVDDLVLDGDLAVASAVARGTAARKPDGEAQPLALRVMWALRRDGESWRIIRQVSTPKPSH